MIHRFCQFITFVCVLCICTTVARANQHSHAIIGRSLLFNPQASRLPVIAITIQYLSPAETPDDNSDLPPFRRVIPIETVYMPFSTRNTLFMNITQDDQEQIIIRSASHPPQERRYSIANQSSPDNRPERHDVINLMRPEGTIWARQWSSSSESPPISPEHTPSSEDEDPPLNDIFDSLTTTRNGLATNNQSAATQSPEEAPAQSEPSPNGLHRHRQDQRN